MTRDGLKRSLRIAFAAAIAELSDQYPLSVTSWIRSPERNRAVGGRANSLHLDGLAVDVVPEGSRPWNALIGAARARGLQVADEGDHLHIELDLG